MAHLNEEQLLEHPRGRLSATDAAHLAQCEECRHRKENLSSIGFAETIAGPYAKPGTPTRPDAPEAMTRSLARGGAVGRYVLLERLGAGGMGEVYAAYDPHLDRKVALKLLRAGSLSAEEGRARLLREGQAMARLQHPNVIAVHDVGTFGDRVFVAMEFVEGETLGEWTRGEHSWRETVRVFSQAGAGLAAAHRAGLVHRDFKPDNVLLGEDGRPRVLDFGLARQAASTPATGTELQRLPDQVGDSTLNVALTRDGAVMGTPGYMAPEQIAGLPTDARCDQFSFCVALYEALYGKRPFGGATLKQHAQEIASGKVVAPPTRTAAPSWVYEVLKKGLSADPSERWADMHSLLVALRPRQSVGVRTVGAIAALVVIAVGVGAWALWQHQRLKVCGGADQRLAGVWDAPTRTRLKQEFLATKLPYAPGNWKFLETVLDAYALDWVNASRDACEAARVRRTDTEELYELKSECLEGRRQRLQALTNHLGEGDPDTVANAITAARSLDPVGGCFDASSLQTRRKADPGDRTSDLALRAQLNHASADLATGRLHEGLALLKKALAHDAPPATLAEAYLLLGRFQTGLGDEKSARASHQLASENALKAGDAALQAKAFSLLAAGADPEDTSGAPESWSRLAHAAAARVPGDWEVDAEVAKNDAVIALHRRRYKAAQADFERVLQLQREHLGPDHPALAVTLNNLGVVSSDLGDDAAALSRYLQSFELHRASEGLDNPNTAAAEHNLASVLRREGRYAEATQRYEHALMVRKATLGADNVETLKTSDALARVYTATGQHDAALGLLNQSLAARQRVEETSPEVAQTYELLAELHLAGRFWKEALRYTALEITTLKEINASRSLLASNALLNQGAVLTRLGQWTDAARALDEARALRTEKLGEENNEVATIVNAQADLAFAQKNVSNALRLYEKAAELRSRAGTSTPQSRASDLLGIGRCDLALERPAEALAPLTSAVELCSNVEDKRKLAEARFELGRALWLASPEKRGDVAQQLRLALVELPFDVQRDAATWLARNAVPPAGADAGR